MNSFKQQPLIAEVLPGFTTLAVIIAAYFFQNQELFRRLVGSQNAATYITALGVVALLSGWIVGTLLDSLRDILEETLDRRWPVNWDYLLTASAEAVKKLDDSWLAYYFLTGNYIFGLLVAIFFCTFSAIRLPVYWLGWLCFALLIFALNFITLRKELRRLMANETVATAMPHDGVFTRLGVSKAKPSQEFPDGEPGVGVFVIVDIKKDDPIFGGDDAPTVLVSRSEVEKLPTNIRKLYHDFAVLEGDEYICPVSFNELTPSWYLNDSDNPNVVCDADLKFRALKDMKAGDELTSRYSDYSDNEKRPT